jgi:two-component system CheB/CheR fusion protein
MKCMAMLRADAERDAQAIVGSLTDIDAQIGAQQTLRDAARRKDEFLAMLGHELRNPLSPIRNAAAVLERIAGDDQQLSWVHDVLVRQVGHVTRLVDDLLDISLITQGTMQLRPEPVDLVIALERAIDSARPIVSRKQQRLDVNLPEKPMWVEGDSIRLVQVFDNLLTNASKYSDERGWIGIGLERQGEQAVVRVRDNGLGISGDMRARIFDLFVQDERSIDRSQGGLGIGLALVRHLVELHGGTIEALSEGVGKGSEFVVRLRLLAQNALPEPPSARPPVRNAGGRVLIVEDDPDVGESMAVLLRVYGYQVERAVDLASARQLAREFHPQAVLMDLAMPGADGYEVARRLRAMDNADPDTVYMAVSGFCQAEDRRRSADAGFVEHLVKPVDPDELDELLKQHLSRHADDEPPSQY